MSDREKVNILLVDDRPENLTALEAILEDLGENLIKASSGEEALRVLLKEDVAVILLDVQMPGMDGFETAVLIRARKRSQNTPIIFVTAVGKSEEHIRRGYTIGAVDYILKPFNAEILRWKVSVFVDLFRLRLELEDANIRLEARVLERTTELSMANELLREGIILQTKLGDELRLSEAELKEAQRVGGVGNWRLDPKTGEVAWSEELCRIFGRDPGRPVPNFKDHAEVLPPESLEKLTAVVGKCVQSGEPYDLDLKFVRPDGTKGWINARGEARRDEEGRILGLRGTALDITERKKAEEQIQKGLKLEAALRKIDDRILRGGDFREALDVACDAILDLGHRMCWIGLAEPDFSVRPVASRGFDEGYLDRMKFRWDESPEGMGPTGISIRTGRTYLCSDILENRIYAPWQEEAARKGFRSAVSIPLRSGEGEPFGVLHVYSDTAERFTPHGVGVLEMFGQQCAISLVNARRIEELRSVHHRLTVHMQRMPLGYIEHDAEFRITGWNPAAERIFGWSAGEAIGKHPFDLIVPPEMQDHVRNIWAKLAEGDDSSFDSAGLAFRKDGTQAMCEWFATPLRDGAGAMNGLHVLVHDVTEKVKLEKQLRIAQKMESVGTLAGGIAHDFNNALTGIVGFGELLRTRLAGDEQGLHDLNEILRCAERASTLTRRLLAYARRQTMEPVRLNLSTLVADLMKLIGKVMGEHIEVKTSLGKDVATIQADRGQIEQVLMNLCLNARDAMPDGGKLLVETEEVYLEEKYVQENPYMRTGGYVLLTVSDTGIGMDEKTRERVFDPFFSTKGPDKGTGLGLAMVYGIVKQHQGFIHLYSEPGEGTAFRIYFPAVDALPDAVPERRREEVVRGGVERILLADDEEVIRSFIERTLKEYGYSVLVARDGEEAVEIFRENDDISLAILDVVMPRKGGREALEEMRNADPSLKAILMSGYAANGIHDSFKLLAGEPFLQKPFGPTMLARKIREVLDSTG